MLKIFIAGGSGYIGKELISFLKKKKEFQLHICYYKNNVFQSSKKNLYTYKINLTKNIVIKKLKKIDPDLIINLAAFINPLKNQRYPKKSFLENVIINRNLTNYCQKYKKRIIYTSTDKIYSGKTKTPSERKDLVPNNIYGFNKLKCENEIRKKLKNYLILRYATAYSDNKMNNKSFINKMINKIKNKKKIYLATNIYRLFVSTEYLSKIIYKLIKKKTIGTFNIGLKATNYYNLVRLICMKKKIPIKNLLFKTKIISSPQYLIPCRKKIDYVLEKH
jgi:dTDP-4-dehydrorhamnose reductase